ASRWSVSIAVWLDFAVSRSASSCWARSLPSIGLAHGTLPMEAGIAQRNMIRTTPSACGQTTQARRYHVSSYQSLPWAESHVEETAAIMSSPRTRSWSIRRRVQEVGDFDAREVGIRVRRDADGLGLARFLQQRAHRARIAPVRRLRAFFDPGRQRGLEILRQREALPRR